MIEVHGFTEDGSISATINGLRASVPNDMGNSERRMIAAWEAEGNTIPAYVPNPQPMPSLEPWQFFAMLDLSGKRDDLNAFIDALPEPNRTVARAKLERSLVFYRDNDLVKAAQGALGLSDAELDGLWLQAKSL